jgi:hypothetical protein
MTSSTLVRSKRVAALVLAASLAACSKSAPPAPPANVFATPEAAVNALKDAAAKSDVRRVMEVFGANAPDVVDASDLEAARRNREVFTAAMNEGWRLEDQGDAKILVVGGEAWPFPVPLIKEGTGWRFDTAKGKEEVLSRRIGRNELAVMRVCRTYVAAQRLYAASAHDNNPKGVYAASFGSDPNRQNGLYWPSKAGQPRSPLGALLEEAEQRAAESPNATHTPVPFHGYQFRILTAQGAAANGGAKNYVVNGRMTAGFALIAWPAQYDSTGVMTFVINQDGVIFEKDLGPDTQSAVRGITTYDPDASWSQVN